MTFFKYLHVLLDCKIIFFSCFTCSSLSHWHMRKLNSYESVSEKHNFQINMCVLFNQRLSSTIVSGSQREGFNTTERIYFTALIFVYLYAVVYTVCFVNFWCSYFSSIRSNLTLKVMRDISCSLFFDTSFHAYLFSHSSGSTKRHLTLTKRIPNIDTFYIFPHLIEILCF